ncbi:MAG: F0F1 ATP synthase subunit delta [Candidatus Saccharimonas sp.]
MAGRLSRRTIASYAATQIQAGAAIGPLLDQVAAYLIDTRRTREAILVVRAIEDTLAARGIVLATVTTATPLHESMQQSITQLINASTVHIREQLDPTVIGGVRVETPGATLDATVARKLLALRQAKV